MRKSNVLFVNSSAESQRYSTPSKLLDLTSRETLVPRLSLLVGVIGLKYRFPQITDRVCTKADRTWAPRNQFRLQFPTNSEYFINVAWCLYHLHLADEWIYRPPVETLISSLSTILIIPSSLPMKRCWGVGLRSSGVSEIDRTGPCRLKSRPDKIFRVARSRM